MSSQYKYPHFTTKVIQGMNQIQTIENRFMQKLIDMRAVIMHMGEFTVMAYESYAMFKVIDDDTILLECISTPSDRRNTGSGTKTMEAFLHAANETNTTIKLLACNVTGNGFHMAQQMVIGIGMVKKNKIPVAKLKGWYTKLGFTANDYSTREKGWNMIYTPITE